VIETPELVEAIVSAGRPVIVVGAHFGAIEMPVSYLAARFGYRLVAPMETVADAGLQGWIERSRASAGIRIVPIAGARRALLDELRAGRSIGLVADRDLTGGGLQVPFFGAPAPFPIGAALLAVETGAPLVVGGARRVGVGRYAGWLSRIEVPATGTRREKVHALVASMAATFEELIAQAPEQWWAAFHPIWPDLEGATEAAAPTRPEAAADEVEVPA
jgi:KDO2-lipid IV(A) lauroyltransferase